MRKAQPDRNSQFRGDLMRLVRPAHIAVAFCYDDSDRPITRRPAAVMHAFMIVDVQEAFDVPAGLIEKISARAEHFPLRIFTQFINPPGTLFRRKMNRRSCAPGDPAARLAIEPKPGDLVLQKPGYGLTPEHIQILRSRDVKEVTVSGVDTDACVLGVMFSLWDHGIDCHIEPELCWSSAGLHEKALEIALEQFGE